MVYRSLAFFVGTFAAFAWPSDPAPWAIAALASGAVLVVVTCFVVRSLFAHRPTVRLAMAVLAAASLGCAYELTQVHRALAHRWPLNRADERVLVTATLDGLPARTQAGVSFDAWIAPAHEPKAWRRHARILWRDAPSVHPDAGQTWDLLLTLRAPTARINPASMDGERQFFRDGIDAVGVVVGTARLNKQTALSRSSLDAFRARIARHIRRLVDDRDAGALIAALAVGATGEMSPEQWRIFSATGTTHLVAISGSHVTMFALAAILVARWLWRLCLCGRVAIPRETFAAFIGLIAATGYAALAGLSVPTLRTLLMLAAWQLGAACARTSGTLPPLCAALVVILIFDPFAALSSGFWLSFAAIVTIALASGARIASPSKSIEAVHVQTALFVSLAPLTLAWFGSLSLAGLMVNAVAIPVIGWILVPLILGSLPLAIVSTHLSDACLWLTGKLCELSWPWMQLIGDSAVAQLYAHPPGWWLAMAAAALVIVLLPWPGAFRFAVSTSVAAIAFAAPHPARASAAFTVFDVGDATAVVVRTANHVLVYGVGDAFGADGSLVDRVIVPLLRAHRIRAIDKVVLGRSSARGSPGLTAILAAYRTTHVGLPRGAPVDFPGAERCSQSARWTWDDVVFETPVAASGCVVRISIGGREVLLASDGEPESPMSAPNAAIVRSADASLTATDFTILSSRRGIDRRSWLSTATSGAVQFTLDALNGLSMPIESRLARSGPWRITPDAAPFGL